MNAFTFSPHYWVALNVFLVGLVGCGGGPSEAHKSTLFPSHLNDSGLQSCATHSRTAISCDQSVVDGQDAHVGRDAAAAKGWLNKIGQGAAGFDFTRLGANNLPLLEQNAVWNPVGSFAESSYWECVHDNHTGLTWEVKHSESHHPRWIGATYSWFSNRTSEHGGVAGLHDGGVCGSGRCDTQGYVDFVNRIRLCGFNDWRLPSAQELFSITYLGNASPLIDRYAFPNMRNELTYFWTSDTVAEQPEVAWYLDFGTGVIHFASKLHAYHLRLVRSKND